MSTSEKESRSLKKELLKRRINIMSKDYKQAWTPIIKGLVSQLDEVQGDVSYLTASNVVSDYTHVPTIRETLMKLINRAYEVGL